MLPNIDAVLIAAIQNKRCLRLRYKDQAATRRVEPHVLYRSAAGRLVLQAYQTHGHSAGNRVPPFWRPFQVRKIATLEVLEEMFNPRVREGYRTLYGMIRGEMLAAVDPDVDEYFYFNAGPYGPPKPNLRP